MVIGTGGLAEIFAPLCDCFDEVDPHLTLRGLALAFALLAGPGRGVGVAGGPAEGASS
jgi:hypothetical protein